MIHDDIKKTCKASLGKILKVAGVGLQEPSFHKFKQLVCDEIHRTLIPNLLKIIEDNADQRDKKIQVRNEQPSNSSNLDSLRNR